MRNSHHSANAPTGNMSIYLGIISGGIEPVFSAEYNRFSSVVEGERASLRADGFNFPDVFKGEWFETEYLKETSRGNDSILRGEYKGVWYEVDKSRGLTKQSRVVDYGYKWCEDNLTPEELNDFKERGVFCTAQDLLADDHLNSLAIFAKYTNMNNSKTINLPNEYSFDDFKHIYERAYSLGIKGTTTYRAGTMTAVLESIKDEQEEVSDIFNTDEVIQENVKLPEEFITKGYVIRDRNKKKWYVNISFTDEKRTKPFAIFVTTNHSETTEVTEETKNALLNLAIEKGINNNFIDELKHKIKTNSNVQAIARTLSLLLRHNVSIIDIVDVLDNGNYPLSSFTFHIKRLLKQFIPDGVETGKLCSECSHELIMQEGCFICPNCGNSKCG
jgi:ribonucleoside-diphosphate reductase alpha chain